MKTIDFTTLTKEQLLSYVQYVESCKGPTYIEEGEETYDYDECPLDPNSFFQ